MEVWVEKDALEGIVSKVCSQLDIMHFSCRGYASQSSLYEAGRRIRRRYEQQNQSTVILHLGDHDPSGIDMTRDIAERIHMFAAVGCAGEEPMYREYHPHIKRIALTMKQVDKYAPPPNPAKVTDSRFEQYQKEYGDESWELDALEPKVLSDLITAHVEEYRDPKIWNQNLKHEKQQKAILKKVADNWGEVHSLL